ncbi:MAG: OmpA family protein [Phycisphaerae bacterium]|nr:OmpA family protein [Phycisphaerae bacterium]
MSNGSKKRNQEEEGGLPGWIVSFTDMITLLLAFFVLLQAFAQEQHPELFNIGRGSFETVIHNFGLPIWRKGRDARFKREWFIRRYSDEPAEEETIPMIDAEEERMQRLFQDVKERFDSESAETMMIPVRVEASPVTFSGDSADLNRQAKQYLDQLAVDLQNNLPPENCGIYLIGLSPDQITSQKTWVLSAQRAQAAEEYLRKKLEEQGRSWPVYSWGGGRTFGRFPEGTYLGLVVMGEQHGGRNG